MCQLIHNEVNRLFLPCEFNEVIYVFETRSLVLGLISMVVHERVAKSRSFGIQHGIS